MLAIAAPAGAVPAGFSSPKRIVAHDGAPTHSTVVTPGGAVHVASEKGSSGIVYATNAGGTWTLCQVSDGDDREPSIAVAAGVVHIAFVRRDGQRGLHTASSDQPSGGGGCGWTATLRHAGGARQPSLGASGSTLHVAFRTSDGKLRYARGASSDPDWGTLETIDRSCCTSAPALGLSHDGKPRVAYGDGTGSNPAGLRYAVRSGSSWKKDRVAGGRIRHVAMTVDTSPDVFLRISNAPSLVYVVKRSGTILSWKGSAGVGGTWAHRFLAPHAGPPDIAKQSNRTVIITGRGGKLWFTSVSGPIFVGKTFSRSGRDGKPQIGLHGIAAVVTYARDSGTAGVYFTRE